MRFMFRGLFGAKTIEQYDPKLSRDDVIRRGRILVIDDERPVLIDALNDEGFAVDHDKIGDGTSKIEDQLYDLVLLDYGGVGIKFGKDQGLCLLRHIKRTAPGTRVLAFTSKALQSDQSDFFRLSDGTLRKDAGLQESLEIIERELAEALRVRNLWSAILELSGVELSSLKAEELERALIKGIKKRDAQFVIKAFTKVLGKALQGAALTALKKTCNTAGIPWT